MSLHEPGLLAAVVNYRLNYLQILFSKRMMKLGRFSTTVFCGGCAPACGTLTRMFASCFSLARGDASDGAGSSICDGGSGDEVTEGSSVAGATATSVVKPICSFIPGFCIVETQ